LPALLAGHLSRSYGLLATTDGYGAILIVLAVGALLLSLRPARAKVCRAP
jgi:asparagine N-glycosylation enzyme membrane subunit Stt3